MSNKFLITDKIKKTNTYIDKTIYNFPHQYNVLKNNISNTLYKYNKIIKDGLDIKIKGKISKNYQERKYQRIVARGKQRA